MPSMVTTVSLNPGSDGDRARWPDASSDLRPVDDEQYRTKIATKWMKERGEALPGMSYSLESLPAGYKLFGKNRENSTHVDRYLYGHAKSRFRSTEEFYDHFIRLMEDGNASRCACKVCKTVKRTAPGSSLTPVALTGSSQKSGRTTGASRPKSHPQPSSLPHSSTKPRPQVHPGALPASFNRAPPPRPEVPDTEPVDDEGTPDIWRQLIEELKEEGTLDRPVTEPHSIDWLLESETLTDHIQSLQRNPAWMPRTGEIVLFTRKASEWEAGIVVQLPEEQVTIKDLAAQAGAENDKSFNIGYSGFRVEPLPEIANQDKPWSKRGTYVAAHQIRPFMLWLEVLSEINEQHPTIQHAMLAMSSFSMLDKFHFKGTWPEATVFCKGMYLGAELVLIGDIVRLEPIGKRRTISEVLHITAIKMKMLRMDGEDTGYENGVPPRYNTCMHVSGHGFTTDQSRAFGVGKTLLDSALLPQGLDKKLQWYPLHNQKKRWEVPFARVIGRCYEEEAMSVWLPAAPTPTFAAVNKATQPPKLDKLSYGFEGCREARTYSSKNDPRINRAEGKTWYWGDDRVEQLDLHTLHGHDVGTHSRYGQDPNTELRQEKHLTAMKKAKKAREKGVRGPYGFKAEPPKNSKSQPFAPSGMVAGSMNTVETGEENEDELDMDMHKKRTHDMMELDGEPGVGGRLSQINIQAVSSDEDDDMLAAEQLLDDFMGSKPSPAKKSKMVIDLDE